MENKKGKIYFIATPIGNLGDITLRALETLQKVDTIFCEDTRVTQKLLQHYKIAKPLKSLHQHSAEKKFQEAASLLKQGKDIALVTDAGTPGLSDPGGQLVDFLSAHNLEEQIVPLPGVSALTALISVAGVNLQKFSFFGFPPHKKGRQKFFQEVIASPYPVIYYESPYRLEKNLSLLNSLAEKEEKELFFVIGKELTKIFEKIIRGRGEIIQKKLKKIKIKGEFTVLVTAKPKTH